MAFQMMKIEKHFFSNPPKPNEINAVRGLRGAAAVLMVASFENYLRSAMEEHLQDLANTLKSDKFDSLPEQLRVNSIFFVLEQAMQSPLYQPGNKRIDRLPKIHNACNTVISKKIDPKVFTNTNSNPNADTLKEMCKAISISDIFRTIRPEFDKRWKKAESNSFLEDKLQEIVNRRHVVAHTGNALNITPEELREAHDFLICLAGSLDRVLKSHVKTTKKKCM